MRLDTGSKLLVPILVWALVSVSPAIAAQRNVLGGHSKGLLSTSGSSGGSVSQRHSHIRHSHLHEISTDHDQASSGWSGTLPAKSDSAVAESNTNASQAHGDSSKNASHSTSHEENTSSHSRWGSAESSVQSSSQEGHEFAEDHVSAWLDIPKDPFTWDGEASWEWGNPRTLYFEPVAGLGNRLRALASAVVIAKEFGVGLKVIWREERGCEGCFNPGFNSTWKDLFSEPKLRIADNFPGGMYDPDDEMGHQRAEDRDDTMPPLQDHQCGIYYPRSHHDMMRVMKTGWKKIGEEDVLCVKSDLWLTEAGEKEGKFFFRLLKPSPMVQTMMDKFKYETEWEENHMVGVHVRRTDLTIWGKNGQHDAVKGLIPIESYINTMKAQRQLAAGVKRVRFFLATDDAEAEATIKAAFKPGYVISFEKKNLSRNHVQGIQEALADVMLLADCPVLIGTYYSSYSETAKMMGWPFYIQVGHDLKSLSIETKFEKDDPDEEDS